MKNIYVLLILFSLGSNAQETLHNYGNLKMHETAQVGFFSNLINDGIFDDNRGLAGFYNNNTATISGAFSPVFEDLEIVVPNNLFLDVAVGITNNSNFILGNVNTPRNLTDINLNYINNAFYNGDSDDTKVDGYAAITNKQEFIFPIGINNKLRPLEISSDIINANAKSAYFFEDPNTPTTFNTSFNTDIRTDILLSISEYEFWDLDATTTSKVTLTWDSDSKLNTFIDALSNLRVVGWNTQDNIWEDLGNTNFFGDFTSGSITSDTFIPNDYTVITFGGSLSKDNVEFDNVIISPNGDEINETFVIDAVTLSPNNKLQIFNRWGRLVYEEDNYKNSFAGIANTKSVYIKKKKLPSGVYFYIINLLDINIIHQGYLYINH